MFFILVISESEKESSDLAASISKVVIIIPLSSSDTESMLFLFSLKVLNKLSISIDIMQLTQSVNLQHKE